MAIKPTAFAEIIAPENTRPLAAPLKKGPISVVVGDVTPENPEHEESENLMVAVKYPNGVVYDHQIANDGDASHIVIKIRNKIRGLHGQEIGDLQTKLPTKIEDLAGKTLVFGGIK